MKPHFNNIYDTKNLNDFHKKLFEDLSEEMFIFKISSDNHFQKILISKSTYKLFEIPNNFISDTILPFIYNRIYKEDKIKVLRLYTQLKKGQNKGEIGFRLQLPKKGLSAMKVFVKTKTKSKGCVIFYVTIFNSNSFEEQKSKKDLPSSLDTNNPETQKNDKNRDFYGHSHRILRITKKHKWILFKAKSIKNNKKTTKIKTNTSIHNQKELELAQKLKEYSEQNKHLTNFTHIVSHNLKTHIGNIKMLLDMIDSEESNLIQEEYKNHLRTVSNDLNETIAHIFQIVNIQNNIDIVKEPLDLNLYLEKNHKIINGYNLEKKATIINKVPKGTIINFNPAYLESILLNLSTNAIKYAHPERLPIIIFDFFIENQKKILTINDNGLGIDLDKYGKMLFGMYKTFHKHENANGIGLYITKKQIESMNGNISVESKPSVGTTFKVTFND